MISQRVSKRGYKKQPREEMSILTFGVFISENINFKKRIRVLEERKERQNAEAERKIRFHENQIRLIRERRTKAEREIQRQIDNLEEQESRL